MDLQRAELRVAHLPDERTTDPTDRRATLARFTETGWQFLRDAYEVKRELEAEYAAVLGQPNFDVLREALEALIEHGQSPG